MAVTGIELSAPENARGAARRPRAARSPVPRADGEITVRVWPFGALAMQMAERPLVLRLSAGANAGDLIAAMGARYGTDFVRQLAPDPGRLARCCRLFANGEPVEELATALSAAGRAVDVEIILIMGYEGG